MQVKLLVSGLLAGSLFGMLLKTIERFTGKHVYVLLLNVDYFPVLKDIKMNEGMEFILHLVVSVLIVFSLYYGLKSVKQHRKVSLYIVCNMAIGGVLFLTTVFSERTPELMDMGAFIYWVGGHAVFGAMVGMMIGFFEKQVHSSYLSS